LYFNVGTSGFILSANMRVMWAENCNIFDTWKCFSCEW